MQFAKQQQIRGATILHQLASQSRRHRHRNKSGQVRPGEMGTRVELDTKNAVEAALAKPKPSRLGFTDMVGLRTPAA